jgi:ABC-2 type transport system ATP-binding protein
VTAALRTERLAKRYAKTWALRDCTLSLPQGRVVALVGPNGAGKTTLLQLAVGLIKPTSGTVEVFGAPVDRAGASLRARVGFVAQEHPLYRGFTVADLLHLGRSLNVLWDQALAERRLDGLGIPLDRRAGSLSGGQQVQVALTLALAKRPRLLVLDEPVANLDPLARRDFLRALMDAVAAEGLTVLLSSHVIAELERVCDHLILLRDGRIRLAADIDDLLAGHRLLVGPRCSDDELAAIPGLLRATSGARHTNLLVRTNGTVELHPRWQAHDVSLEELVLAYLEQPHPAAATEADG